MYMRGIEDAAILCREPFERFFRDYRAVLRACSREKLIEQYQADCTEAPLDSPPDQLSSREKEILIELVKGLSNKEVSDRLCLSVYTVMTHRRNICRKLKIHSLSGLTIYALSNKLIDM